MDMHTIKVPYGMRATAATGTGASKKNGSSTRTVAAPRQRLPNNNQGRATGDGELHVGKRLQQSANISASGPQRGTTQKQVAPAAQHPELNSAHSRAVAAMQLLHHPGAALADAGVRSKSSPWQDWATLLQADAALQEYKQAKARGTGRMDEEQLVGGPSTGLSTPEIVYLYPRSSSSVGAGASSQAWAGKGPSSVRPASASAAARGSRAKSLLAAASGPSLSIDIDGGVRFRPLRGVVYAPSDSLHGGYGAGAVRLGSGIGARRRRASFDSIIMPQLHGDASSSASAVGPAQQHFYTSGVGMGMGGVSRFGDLASPKRVTDKPMAASGRRQVQGRDGSVHAQAPAPPSPTAGGILEGQVLELPGAGPPHQRLSVHHVQGLGSRAGVPSAHLPDASPAWGASRPPVLIAPHATSSYHSSSEAGAMEAACAVDDKVLLFRPTSAAQEQHTRGRSSSPTQDGHRSASPDTYGGGLFEPVHDRHTVGPQQQQHAHQAQQKGWKDKSKAAYTGHTQTITALASHPYLPILASAQLPEPSSEAAPSSTNEGPLEGPVLHVWHAHTQHMLCTPLSVPAATGVLVQDCAFSPCGRYLCALLCDVQHSQPPALSMRHTLCTWDLYSLDAPAATSSPTKGAARAPVASTVGFGGPLIGAYLRGEIGPRLLPGSPSDTASIASPHRSMMGQMSPPLSAARSPIPSSASGASDVGSFSGLGSPSGPASLGASGMLQSFAPPQANWPSSVVYLSDALATDTAETILGLRSIEPLAGQASLLMSKAPVGGGHARGHAQGASAQPEPENAVGRIEGPSQYDLCAIVSSKQLFHARSSEVEGNLAVSLQAVDLSTLADGQGMVLDASAAHLQSGSASPGSVTVVVIDGLHPTQPSPSSSSHSLSLPQGKGCTVGVYLNGTMVTVITFEHDASFSGISCLSQAFLPPGARSRCQESTLFAVCFLDGVVSLLECVAPASSAALARTDSATLQAPPTQQAESMAEADTDLPPLAIKVVGTLNVPCADGQACGLSVGSILRSSAPSASSTSQPLLHGASGRVKASNSTTGLTLHLVTVSSEGLLHCTSQSLAQSSDGLVRGSTSLQSSLPTFADLSYTGSDEHHIMGETDEADMNLSLIQEDDNGGHTAQDNQAAGPIMLSMQTSVLQHSAGAGGGTFTAVAVHPYLPLYAVGTTNGRIDLYDSGTKQRLSTTDIAFEAATILGPRYTGMGVTSLDFCPDGVLLAISLRGPAQSATVPIGQVFIAQLKLPMEFLQSLMGVESAPRASPAPMAHGREDAPGVGSAKVNDNSSVSVDEDGSVGSHKGLPAAAAAKPLSPGGVPIPTNNPLLMAAGSTGRGPSPMLANPMTLALGANGSSSGQRQTPEFETGGSQGLGLGMTDLTHPASSPGAGSVSVRHGEKARDVAQYISAALKYGGMEDIFRPAAVNFSHSFSSSVSMLELYAHSGLDKSYTAVPTCVRWAPAGTTPGGTPVVHAPVTAAGSSQRGRPGSRPAAGGSGNKRQGAVSPGSITSGTGGTDPTGGVAMHDIFMPAFAHTDERPLPDNLNATLSSFLPGVQAHLGVVRSRGQGGAALGSAATSVGAPTLAVGTDACTIEVFVLDAEGKHGSQQGALLKRKKTLRHLNPDARLAVPVLGKDSAHLVLNSSVISLDWEQTGRFLQAGTDAWEVHTWEADGGTKVRHAAAMRDVAWATQSCTLAWHMAGAWTSNPAAHTSVGMLNCSATAAGCDITVTGHADGSIRVHRYPALSPFAMPTVYAGHGGEAVLGVAFLANDEGLITYSAHSIIVWAVEDLGAFTPAVAPPKKHTSGDSEPLSSILERHVQRSIAARARLLQPPRSSVGTTSTGHLQRAPSASADANASSNNAAERMDSGGEGGEGRKVGQDGSRPALLTALDATLVQATGIGSLSLDEPQASFVPTPPAAGQIELSDVLKSKGKEKDADVPFEFVNIASPTTPTSRQMKEFIDKLDAQREAMHREAEEEKRAEDRARQLSVFAHPARTNPGGHAPGEAPINATKSSTSGGGKKKGGKGKKR